jgi:hypothetical protein
VNAGVTRGGTKVNGVGSPPGGWKPGDLLWPRESVSKHIVLATGNGTETVEAACTACGMKVSNLATDSVQYWARPAELIPARFRTHVNNPAVVDPRARID